jgi:hypothetical protein
VCCGLRHGLLHSTKVRGGAAISKIVVDGRASVVAAVRNGRCRIRLATGSIASAKLFTSLQKGVGICERAAKFAELAVSKYTEHPRTGKLVRLGYLVAPNVLSYVNAGYSGSQWSGVGLSTLLPGGGPVVATTPSFTRNGWFVGGGFENNLSYFGITAPGWFMKTEYRSAFYDRITLPETFVGGGLPDAAVTFKPWVQTVSTSLVYRFNWGAPRY